MSDYGDKFSVKDLIEILAMGGVLIAAIAAPNAVQAFKFISKDKNNISFKKFSQSRVRMYANRLEKSGAIKRKRQQNQIEFVLTEKGRRMAQKYNIDKVELNRKKRWDGVWRVIIFDIPERKKQARDALRRKFLSMGVYQLQKSVFVYPYECKREINLIADFFSVGEDILYLRAKIDDVDKKIRDIFNI
jgi:DNA-binding transcriptional regulator PaaX